MYGISVKVTLFLAALLAQWKHFQAICYFPQQFQGEFVMQSGSNVGSALQYVIVDVNTVAIPIWGMCHRKIGNNFILMLNYRETSCVRCLHLKLRSANVLQVFTLNQSLISECYTTTKLAEENCPSEESLANNEATEILLFKTKDANSLQIRKEYCPIDGKFSVRYKSYDSQKPNECIAYDSILDSCPSGSIMNFRLGGCSYENKNLELRFECLGSWKAANNQNYLVFTDNRVKTGQKVKYRCALYSRDYKTGEIQMALSRDSTCITDLYNSTTGFETFLLTPKTELPWPVEASLGTCNFPKWMHGNWEHVRVDEDTMIYKDHSSFKTYTIKCVGVQEEEDKYLIFSRTQCNEEQYNCIRILKRTTNILEFQIGANGSSANHVFALCSDDNFQDDSWITQGRTDLIQEVSTGKCPISGEYVGVIPDGEDLCAKLWSACDTSELMYFEVSHCKTHEVFEERKYKCLGHWREGDYLYTYTQRRDVADDTYECFVGMKISNQEIFIKEAGEHCQRHVNPLQYGMQLNKTSLSTCNFTTPRSPSGRPTRPTTKPLASTLPTEKSTTRVWNFDNSGAETSNNENSSSNVLKTNLLLCVIVYILKTFV